MDLSTFYKSNYENSEQRKITFRKIGEQVYNFFQDIAPTFGFEDREGQWDMACEIVNGILDKKHVLIEAGVGIGKTFAYIVPILYYHNQYKSPIIIATSTIALQEQLAKDLIKIKNMIGYDIEVIMAKGQSHFLCRNRFIDYFTKAVIEQNDTNQVIYNEIQNGGYEKASWSTPISDTIWNNIKVKEFNQKYCRDKCSYKLKCHFYQTRQKMLATNGIIICNQDLLTVNLHKKARGMMPIMNSKVKVVIIDEVHNLEAKVRSSVTKEMTYQGAKSAVSAIKNINPYINDFSIEIEKINILLDIVFEDLKEQIEKQKRLAEKEYQEIDRFSVNTDIEGLNDLKNKITNILFTASMQGDVRHRGKDFDIELDQLQEYKEFLESMNNNESNDIFWLTMHLNNISIFKCPKLIDKITKDIIFGDDDFTTILTSATITSGCENDYKCNYNYFIKNTGFPIDNGLVLQPQISPFLYDEHAMIYYTENMPHPTHHRKKFIIEGANQICELLKISSGKALILFTAKTDMEDVYNILSKRQLPYQLLIQHGNSTQTKTINKFKENVNSVLLGTGSYWEGISIEGVALSHLIIFKLPFPVREPIIDYKWSISNDGLMEISVPEMIIKLKQGIGRLIRSESDKGIVSIIDSRVGDNSKSSYKNIIWDSLPIKNKTNRLEEIEQFYQKINQD